jgi:hypothetical protein
MPKTFCFDRNYFLIFLFVIILIILIIYIIVSYYIQNNCIQCTIQKNKDTEIITNKIKNIENNLQETTKRIENYQSNKETVVNTINYPNAVIQRDPKTLNSLDRIYNPLKYPYKSDYFYDQSWYPNLELPFQVLGCGSRNTPCLGGTQVPIYNPPTPIDISNTNIAPVYISTRGPLGQPQQVGILYKINGNDNDILPLFGRRKYPNDNIYEYYTIMGQYGVKVPIVTKNKKDELGTNDVVFIKGNGSPYRVTIYKSDFPEYIPYM